MMTDGPSMVDPTRTEGPTGLGAIDLRDQPAPTPAPPPPPPWVASEDAGRSAVPSPAEVEGKLRRRRWTIVAVLVCCVGLVGFDFVAGRVIHDQRQRHLAAEIVEPKQTVETGDPVMILQIPKIGVNQVVIEGASAQQLRSGPGHVAGTVVPGSGGRSVVIGRSFRYGAPFRDLGDLAAGDAVAVKTRLGSIVTYAVSSVDEVALNASIPRPDSSGPDQIVLVTSDGAVRSDRRVVVTATAGGSSTTPSPAPTTTSPTTTAPTDAGGAPPATAQTDVAAPDVTADQLDERPSAASTLVSFVLMAALIALVVVGSTRLRLRYSVGVAVAVVSPVVVAAALVAMAVLDAFLPVSG